MPVLRGRILIHNTGKEVRIIADNRGDSPGTLTHSLFRTVEKAQENAMVNGVWVSHDDMNYGHSHYVPANGVEAINLPYGGEYVRGRGSGIGTAYWETVKITEGTFLRVGFRNQAHSIVPMPAVGQALEIPYTALKPNLNENGLTAMWRPSSFELGEGGGHASVIEAANALTLATQDLHVVKGHARLVPLSSPTAPTELAGWSVEFENSGVAQRADQTNGFTGTVVLVNAAGKGAKNAGLGLESMPCPDVDWTATQLIANGGDYGKEKFGVVAVPGGAARLGVRGLSNLVVELPTLAQGAVQFDLASFALETTKSLPEWFDGKAMTAKLGEKKAQVGFLHKGERINDSLPDTVYTGAEAFMKAEFKQPPRLTIEALPASAKLPLGGWAVKASSELPNEDALGPIGFRLELKTTGKLGDSRVMPPVQFTPSVREHSAVLALNTKVGGVALKEGTELIVDTGPLGWRGSVRLPSAGQTLDTSANEATLHTIWSLRESDYRRVGLIHRGEEPPPASPRKRKTR